MKYRVNLRVIATYQVDVDCDFEDVVSAARKQCKNEYGVDITDELEIENIERVDDD
jgi:Leu/Phe-tRNA-protein transferase